MSNITADQFQQMQAIREKWMACAFNSQRMDRANAELGIIKVYQSKNVSPPQRILWVSSPLQAILIMAYLCVRHWRRLWRYHRSISSEATWQAFKQELFTNFGDSIPDPLWDDVSSRDSIELELRHPQGANEVWQDLLQHFADLERRVDRSIPTVVFNALWPDDLDEDALMHLLTTGQRGEFAGWLSIEWGQNGGQHNIYRLACYDGWRHISEYQSDDEQAEAHRLIAESAGWWWGFDTFAIVSDRPRSIRVDDQFRLHCENGAAITYRDGWSVYCWHGVRVPENAILAPETITVAQIENQRNVETRRILMERYGIERYLIDSEAVEIHRDRFGVLYRRFLGFQEPLVMVKVTNHTPEPDGSYREYFIRVPPHMQTAHEAVAWTFGLKPNQYHPGFES